MYLYLHSQVQRCNVSPVNGKQIDALRALTFLIDDDDGGGGGGDDDDDCNAVEDDDDMTNLKLYSIFIKN